MYFNRSEALRYFGAGVEDKQAGVAVDLAFLKLRNELQPRYTVLRLPCLVTEKQIVLAAVGTAGLEQGAAGEEAESAQAQLAFNSLKLAQHLAGCQELYLFGATLGSKVDVALRRIALGSAAEGAAGQAAAASLIETYCDDCCRELEEALPEGYGFTSRFSPGYGDWPLEEQQLIFKLLNCAKLIGLTLTDGGMMAPIKSVTAVLGVHKSLRRTYAVPRSCVIHKCSQCTKDDCEFRR